MWETLPFGLPHGDDDELLCRPGLGVSITQTAQIPNWSKVPKYGVSMVSVLGIILMVWGRYLVIWVFRPLGLRT